MKIVYDNDFDKVLKKLPPDIQKLYKNQEILFRNNWRDSRLHIKKLINQPFPFSFRITRAYRVLFVFIAPETAFFATIAHRKDIYR
jgi:mRNA-degrading endonuclease RelE of RelBE toxin-antitoxin system